MSTLVLSERPLRLWDEPGARSFREPARREPVTSPAGEPTAPQPARLTLADVLGAAWDGLAARATVACPVCHGELAPHGDGGRCRSCGTTLS